MPQKKHLSLIEAYARTFDGESIKREKGKTLQPGDKGFYMPECSKTLFRKWQVNPETGATCFTMDQYYNIEKIPVDPKFRMFFQRYRTFNTFLSYEHAEMVRDQALRFLEAKQYELYGITKQLELFEEQPQAEFRLLHALN